MTAQVHNRPIKFNSLFRHVNGNANKVPKHSLVISIGEDRLLIDPGSAAQQAGTPRIDNLRGIFLTHAHLDHFGGLLGFLKKNPNVPAYCTPATKYLMTQHALKKPVMGKRDECLRLMERIHTYELEREIGITRSITAVFHEAGHILGSAAVTLECPEGKFLFTGDYSTQNRGVFSPFSLPARDYRAIISEGSFIGLPEPDYNEKKQELTSRIDGLFESGACLMVSLDTLGLAQEFVLYLARLMQEGEMRKFPIFCFDYERVKEPGGAIDPYSQRILLSYAEYFGSLSDEFKRAFGGRKSELTKYFGSLVPVGKTFDPAPIHSAIFAFDTRGFKMPVISGFNVADFGRAIFEVGGMLLLNGSQHVHGGFFVRLGLDAQTYQDSLLFSLPFNHPYSRNVENIIREAGAKTNILVHGRPEDLRPFAASLPQRIIVPKIGEEVEL